MFVAQHEPQMRSTAPAFPEEPSVQPRASAPSVICFPFSGGIAGGSHISSCKLIQSLDRRHFTPLILLHHDQGEVAELLKTEGLSYEVSPNPHHFGRAPGIERQGGIAGFARALASQWPLAEWLRARRVRIVHTNEGPMHVSWALPALLAGAKLLWHHRSSPDARGLRFLAPFLADHVVSVSSFALSGARAYRGGRDCSVVYSPFDTDTIAIDRASAREKLVEELGVAPSTGVIGFFGNFVERKRPLLFVDVIAELSRQAPDLPVAGLMFGSTIVAGLDKRIMERAQAKGVADRVRLMGFRYPAGEWLAACDVHAITAVGEPFGRSLIEAMLLGTPVVAVASGGNIEAIRQAETGYLTPPDDARAMARTILQLLRHPDDARAIAARARAEALRRFGRERHSREIGAIYQKLLSGGNG